MSDGNSTQVAALGGELTELSRKVARGRTRVQIDLPDGDGPCIIISKAELDGLERALEILADHEGTRQVCASIEKLAEQCRRQWMA